MLENGNIRLRALEPTDLEAMFRWENDTTIWDVGNTHNPYSRYVLTEYLRNTHGDVYEDKELRLVIELKAGRTSIGCIDLYDFDFHNRKAGVSILIEAAYRKQGFAAQAVALLCQYAFQFLKLHQLYAYIPQKNNASKALFSKCGFQQTALFPHWIRTTEGFADVCLFQLIEPLPATD